MICQMEFAIKNSVFINLIDLAHFICINPEYGRAFLRKTINFPLQMKFMNSFRLLHL